MKKLTFILLISFIIGLVIFAIASWLRFYLQSRWLADLWSWGFPWVFRESWGPCQSGEVCSAFYPHLFIADILFWWILTFGGVLLVIRLAIGRP